MSLRSRRDEPGEPAYPDVSPATYHPRTVVHPRAMKFRSSIKAASSLAKKGVPGDVYRLRADASMIWTYLHIAAVSIFPASLASRAWRALETIGDAAESTRASATSMPRHRRVLTFLACNSLFMLVEFAVGAADDSIGLLSDAFHMLFDNASLVLALVAMRNPFGHANAEALAGFVNGVSLVFVSIGIVRESATRFIEPKPMGSSGLMTTSVIGLAVNALGLLLCAEAHTHSHRDGTSCPALSGWGGGKCENAEVVDFGGSTEIVPSPTRRHAAMMGAAGGTIWLVDTDARARTRSIELMGFGGGDGESRSRSLRQSVSFSEDGLVVTARSGGWPESGETRSWCVRTGVLLRGTIAGGDEYDEMGADLCRPIGDASSGMTSRQKKPKPKPKPKAKSGDANMRAVFLHVLADTLGSVGVIVSTYLVQTRGWAWADPAAAVFIAFTILAAAAPLLATTAGSLWSSF